MRTFFGVILGLSLVSLVGCDQGVADSELGTIVYQVPKIEEPGDPFEMPHIPAPPGFKPSPRPFR